MIGRGRTTQYALMWRERAAVVGLLLCGALMLFLALGLSWSQQWIAEVVLAVGGLTVWGFTAAAIHAGHRRRPIRPWIIRSFIVFAAVFIVSVVSWNAIDAIRRG